LSPMIKCYILWSLLQCREYRFELPNLLLLM